MNPAKGTKIEYRGKTYTFNGKAWETMLGNNIVEIPEKDKINETLNTEYIRQTGTPKPSPTPDGIKDGTTIKLPTDTKRDGTTVKNVYSTYTYSGGKWVDESGKEVDGKTQEKITKAAAIPKGTEVKGFVYQGDGVWSDTRGGGTTFVNASKSKELFFNAYDSLAKKYNVKDIGLGTAAQTFAAARKTDTPLAKKTTPVTPPVVAADTNLNRGLAEIMKRGDAGLSDTVPQIEQPISSTRMNSGLQGIFGGGALQKAAGGDLSGAMGGIGGATKGAGLDVAGIAGYLPDVFKAALGFAGANQKLPEFQIPQYFTDYERRLRELSTQGLTQEELATAGRSAERGYAYDINNVERFSGGRPGVALSNLGRAASTYQDTMGNINLADAQMRRQNLASYGGILGTHLGLDQSIFNTKYNEVMQNKLAGAQLASDALSNIDERQQYNKFYGDNSTYGKYMQSLQAGQEYQNQLYQYQLQNPGTLPGYNPNIINENAQIPQYFNQYYGG